MPSSDPRLIFEPFIGQPAGTETGPINELGTRGPSPDLSAPRRILLIGDSVAYGLGVPDESTFARSLERKIGNGSTAVINGAVPGYETWQERRRLEQLAPRVRPTDLVVQFFGNDKWRTPAEIRQWAASQRMPRQIVYADRPRTVLFRLSALFQLAATQAGPAAAATPPTPANSDWPAEWTALLRTAKGVTPRTIVLLMPSVIQVEAGAQETDPDAARIAQSLDIEVLDPIEPIRADGSRHLYLDGDSTHLNRRGHELVANLLRQRVAVLAESTRPAIAGGLE